MSATVITDTDTQLLARAVKDLSQRTRFPVAFGGLERDGAIVMTAIAGARSRNLEGLVVRAERGLGGAAFSEKRPRLALDYRTSRSITHDYDRAVLGEGITTLYAVPIVVSGVPRGVIYCGSWHAAPVGDAVARPAFAVADAFATELRVREEVQRRLQAYPPTEPMAKLGSVAQEELRESFAELRSIASTISDSGVRDRLAQVERRLAALSGERPGTAEKLDVPLSPRELDVLACCALGHTNAQIGASLGLKEATVKSYLAAAMAKLDASTRHAAVAKARRVGILP